MKKLTQDQIATAKESIHFIDDMNSPISRCGFRTGTFTAVLKNRKKVQFYSSVCSRQSADEQEEQLIAELAYLIAKKDTFLLKYL